MPQQRSAAADKPNFTSFGTGTSRFHSSSGGRHLKRTLPLHGNGLRVRSGSSKLGKTLKLCLGSRRATPSPLLAGGKHLPFDPTKGMNNIFAPRPRIFSQNRNDGCKHTGYYYGIGDETMMVSRSVLQIRPPLVQELYDSVLAKYRVRI